MIDCYMEISLRRQYVHVKALVFICAATLLHVQVASEGSSGNAVTIGEDQLKRIFDDLKEVDNSQQISIQRLQNTSHFLMTKIDNLEEQLGVVSGDLNEVYRSLTNILGYWTKHILPFNDRVNKRRKGSVTSRLLCPLRKCYRRSQACKHMVKSFKIISTVEGVTSNDGCALFCSENSKCQAFRYVTETRACILIRHISKIIETDDNQRVAIWIKLSSRLGRCPYYFNIWGRRTVFKSEYRLVKKKTTWAAARRNCERQGGKLAELTTKKEIEYLQKQLPAVMVGLMVRDWHIGGWRNNTESGWQWYYSKTRISSELLSDWDEGKSERNDKRFLNSAVVNFFRKFHFKNVTSGHQSGAYLCECIEF